MNSQLRIDNNTAFFQVDRVEAETAEHQAGDPDWTYTTVYGPEGSKYARIIIHDEDGEFVSYV